MIDSRSAKNRFDVIMQLTSPSSARIQLLRIIEFLEVINEAGSRDLMREYAPRLVVRVARLAHAMDISDMTVTVSERLIPILWTLIIDYPEIDCKGICLAVVQHLRVKQQNSSFFEFSVMTSQR